MFLHGIYGVREGTVAAAILVGTISRQINKGLESAARRTEEKRGAGIGATADQTALH